LDEPNDDMHDFSLKSAIAGLRIKLQDDGEVMRVCEPLLDGVLINLKNKIHAEEIIDTQGHSYTSYWGKTLAVETENDEILQLAAKRGFEMAIRKSKQHGHVRIKLHPKSKKNLNKLHALLTKEDDIATWYYHPSGKMLLNISSKNRNFKATKLSLNRIIEITKHIT